MKRKKIMVVEDDLDLLDEFTVMLHMEGYDVTAVPSGEGALVLATQIKPDVILLDIKMKNLSGFQVADRLSRSPNTSDIPIIAMTGIFTRKEDTHLMRVCGIKSRLVKPVSPAVLISEIKEALDSSLN
jgi:CheY-like chemotaxis protein